MNAVFHLWSKNRLVTMFVLFLALSIIVSAVAPVPSVVAAVPSAPVLDPQPTVTNVANLTIKGKVDPSVTDAVYVYADGLVIGSPAADPDSGRFEVPYVMTTEGLHEFYAKSVNADGDIDGNHVQVTYDKTPAAKAEQVRWRSGGTDSIWLEWIPGWNVPEVATGYRIYRNGAAIADVNAPLPPKEPDDPPRFGFMDTGLTERTSYSYQIVSLDAAGNESAPQIAGAATIQAGLRIAHDPEFVAANTLALSPDGFVAAYEIDGPQRGIIFWDSRTNAWDHKVVLDLWGPEKLSLSREGARVAAMTGEQIYVYDRSTDKLDLIYDSAVENRYASLLRIDPKGERVFYAVMSEDANQVRTIEFRSYSVATGQSQIVRSVTEEGPGTLIKELKVSSDGRFAVYTRTEPDEFWSNREVFLLDLTTGEEKFISDYAARPDISADGEIVTFVRGGEFADGVGIYRYKASTGQLMQVRDGSLNAFYVDQDLSDDGTTILAYYHNADQPVSLSLDSRYSERIYIPQDAVIETETIGNPASYLNLGVLSSDGTKTLFYSHDSTRDDGDGDFPYAMYMKCRIDCGSSPELKGLTVSGTLAPAFDPLVTEYTVNVGYDTVTAQITPSLYGAGTKVVAGGNQTGTGAPITVGPLAVGDNAFSFKVRTQEGIEKAYTVHFVRANAPAGPGPGPGPGSGGGGGGGGSSASAPSTTLNSLDISPYTLKPAFSSTVLDYSMDVAHDVASVEFKIKATDANRVKVTVNGTEQKDGSPAKVSLQQGANVVKIVVKSDMGTVTTYTVTVNRAAPPKQPDKPTVNFSDIEGHWAKNSILESAKQGWVEGYPDGSFRPYVVMNRQEWSMFMYRFFGWPEPKAAPKLTDADKVPAWANAAVGAAYEQKIVTGFYDGSFRPLETIGRVEAMVMLVRALKLETKSSDRTTFDDDASIQSWAKPYVAAMQRTGLLKGVNGNRFNPDGMFSRAEAAELLVRINDYLNKQGK
ncbi:cadherin-like beta sandwich domain-containing protein [Cohnella cholangitidis]|uniref:S-layer homology domain-containing protein n=1 Tax=Cohnella cholangitidis TaxID=2598458 RepID=A0A7G5C0S3_9BACL|nr:cadherin-like beta sandwich domain-containing protein [Cohnella cholangitidis]QMV42807.1 hypothetical protein FPL14_17635 [Cohnella cholangitidis]